MRKSIRLAKIRRYNPLGYIYKIINNINGLIYIGQCHYTPEETPNYFGSGIELKNDIEKYGIDSFSKEILEREINSFEKLEEREIYWTNYFNPRLDPLIGYNRKMGNGCVLSDRLLEKMSKSQKEWNPRQPLTDEHKKKISIKTQGKNNPFYGKNHTKHSKQKMSSKKIGKKRKTFSYKHREKLRLTKLGKNNPNSKQVNCFIEENIYKTFNSVNEASRILGITKGRLLYAIKNKIECDSYKFSY